MKVERVSTEPAYILHTWPFREASSILDVLSEQHGRVRLVARAAKRAKGGHVLRPFNRLALSWSGREELKSLTGHELLQHRWLQGDALLAGLYANEITLRALRRYKAEDSLFVAYERMLEDLVLVMDRDRGIEAPLRGFELRLLSSIGYGMSLEVDSEGKEISVDGWYQFDESLGLVPAGEGEQSLSGESLVAFAERGFDDSKVRRTAKRLMRAALAPHIGPAPLASRELHE